ncbi:MAG: hypothetical protein AAGI37_10115 [Planctomycetota bacterium]
MVSPSPKQRVAELLSQLPDNATYDEIQHHLHAAEVIRQRIAKSGDPNTEFLSHDEAKQRLSKWLSD